MEPAEEKRRESMPGEKAVAVDLMNRVRAPRRAIED